MLHLNDLQKICESFSMIGTIRSQIFELKNIEDDLNVYCISTNNGYFAVVEIDYFPFDSVELEMLLSSLCKTKLNLIPLEVCQTPDQQKFLEITMQTSTAHLNKFAIVRVALHGDQLYYKTLFAQRYPWLTKKTDPSEDN